MQKKPFPLLLATVAGLCVGALTLSPDLPASEPSTTKSSNLLSPPNTILENLPAEIRVTLSVKSTASEPLLIAVVAGFPPRVSFDLPSELKSIQPPDPSIVDGFMGFHLLLPGETYTVSINLNDYVQNLEKLPQSNSEIPFVWTLHLKTHGKSEIHGKLKFPPETIRPPSTSPAPLPPK